MSTQQIEKKIDKLPPFLLLEISDYIDFLVSKYSRSNEKRKKLKFDWEGGLSELTEQYNSVELQHHAMEWR